MPKNLLFYFLRQERIRRLMKMNAQGTNVLHLNQGLFERLKVKLPKEATNRSESICVVGDFNNWDIHANPMTKTKNEDWTTRLELERGKEYQFRYLIDESIWENDWDADRYVKSCYSDCDNSMVVT